MPPPLLEYDMTENVAVLGEWPKRVGAVCGGETARVVGIEDQPSRTS